ncbi:MAG: type II secretion system protein, partial [Candidatus Omnitrophica bacterium]|nr:type II secretion system protein [Candidatus Omnitrophota bacterium]
MFIRLHNNKGFTLVELLIVIAIITILATFLIPSIGSGRERARQAKCLNNVRVLITQALLNAEDYTGNFQGYPSTLGSMFTTNGNIDIAAADCPSTSNIPS